MGAVANMRPELFRAVVSHVPFVDVMNTMLDASLPLTVPEYEEWGDPNQEEYFKYMLSYSPYDNLACGELSGDAGEDQPARQPGDVLGAGEVCGEAADAENGSNPLLLVTNMQAGHGGASGRYDYLKEIALDYAFVLRELGSCVIVSASQLRSAALIPPASFPGSPRLQHSATLTPDRFA